jgi:hypothetical protein
MQADTRKNQRVSIGKIRLAPAFSGFRNSGGKGFLSLPGDRTEEFIPKTGRSNQKARKSKSTPGKSRDEENRLEWKSPCFKPVGA